MEREAGAAGDEVAEDDVLLEAAEFIHPAHRRGLGQHARRVLEGRGGDERVGLERGLGDAEERGLGLRRAAAFHHHLLVHLEERLARDLLAPEEVGVARVRDADLAEHLADDDLDVLVVDLDALETVDLLHFVDEVLFEFLRTRDLEDLLRDDRAFGELLALLHAVALEHDDLLAHRDQVLLDEAGDAVDDLHAALAAHVLAELDLALDLRDLGRVLGLAGLEELGDARKAAGDVTRLRGFTRRLREKHAGGRLHTVAHHHDGARRDVVRVEHLAVRAADLDTRVEVGLGSRKDDERLGAGRAVGPLRRPQ